MGLTDSLSWYCRSGYYGLQNSNVATLALSSSRACAHNTTRSLSEFPLSLFEVPSFVPSLFCLPFLLRETMANFELPVSGWRLVPLTRRAVRVRVRPRSIYLLNYEQGGHSGGSGAVRSRRFGKRCINRFT